MRIKFVHNKILACITLISLVFNYIPIQANADEEITVLAPITWERSSEEVGEVLGVKERKWNWSIASGIETPIIDITKIWDAQHEAYYRGYINKMNGNIHSSATWKTQNSVDLRRFRGTFTIPEGYSTEDFVRLRSIVQDQYSNLNEGNIIAINDNIYVFVYPETVSDLITDDENSPYYFINYLAFWTGTANRPNFGIQTFYGKMGTYATRDTRNGPKVTDGWYAEATIDNLGTVMHNTTNGSAAGTKFVIDVFTEDNSPGGGGGMDEMVLEFKKNPHASIKAHNESYAVPTNKETLIQSENGLLANDGPTGTVTSVLKEGYVDDFEVKSLHDGTYEILKGEQLVAKINYIDEVGQFKIQPTQDYIGEIKFAYNVCDKLGKSEEAQTTLYVLPQVTVKHIDVDTNEVISNQVASYYGNPYKEMAADTFFVSGLNNVASNLEIQQATVGEEYKYISGEIISQNDDIEEISIMPYNYSYKQANENIILKYKNQTTHLTIAHQYSKDVDKNYEVEVAVEPNSTVKVKDYIDTTAQGIYEDNAKYTVTDIILEQEDQHQSISLANIIDKENVTVDEILTLLAGKNYRITIYYDIQSYIINEAHIYLSEDNIIRKSQIRVPYGTEYKIAPINEDGYEFITYIVENNRAIEESITVEKNLSICYYYIPEKLDGGEEEGIPDIPGSDSDEEIEDEIIPGGSIPPKPDNSENEEVSGEGDNNWEENVGDGSEGEITNEELPAESGSNPSKDEVELPIDKGDTTVIPEINNLGLQDEQENPLTGDIGIGNYIVTLVGAMLILLFINKKKK